MVLHAVKSDVWPDACRGPGGVKKVIVGSWPPDTGQRVACRLLVCISGTVEGLGARSHLGWRARSIVHLYSCCILKLQTFTHMHIHECAVTLDKHGNHAVWEKYFNNNNSLSKYRNAGKSHSHAPLVFALSLCQHGINDYTAVCGDWHWNGRLCLLLHVPFLSDELDKFFAVDRDITLSLTPPVIYHSRNNRMSHHGVVCPSTINNKSYS